MFNTAKSREYFSIHSIIKKCVAAVKKNNWFTHELSPSKMLVREGGKITITPNAMYSSIIILLHFNKFPLRINRAAELIGKFLELFETIFSKPGHTEFLTPQISVPF